MGNAIDGAPKIVVNDDKAYSFGDPANITFQTDHLTDGFTEFMVGKEADYKCHSKNEGDRD